MVENGVLEVQKAAIFGFRCLFTPTIIIKILVFDLLFVVFEASFEIFKANFCLKLTTSRGQTDHF